MEKKRKKEEEQKEEEEKKERKKKERTIVKLLPDGTLVDRVTTFIWLWYCVIYNIRGKL